MEQLQQNCDVNGKLNQMDDEKTALERYSVDSRKLSADVEKEEIPEIKDIYDYIYGNVKNKRVFYESKQISVDEEPKKRANSITSTPSIDEGKHSSQEFDDLMQANQILETKICDVQAAHSETIEEPINDEPSPRENLKTETSDFQKINFVDERTEILNEINANLKLELDRVKQQLKLEISKTNSLNFEIANIESILETYYKEANNPKSTLSAIYSAMKYYMGDEKNTTQESYTFKRIKAISNYVEILKHKFEHQDRIIKNNFVENPYYADLMTRHEAILKQLDKISLENQKLKEDLKNKETHELDTIKELNRQKFEVEKNYKEMDAFYKEKMTENAIFVENIKQECNQKLKNLEYVLEKSKEDKVELKKACEAKLSNYKQELTIVYGKWSKFKLQYGEKIVPNIEL